MGYAVKQNNLEGRIRISAGIMVILSVVLCYVNILLAQPQSARKTFDKLKEAYEKQDTKLYEKCITKDSVNQMKQMEDAGARFTPPKDIIFVSEDMEDGKGIIKCIETDQDGNKNELNYYFILENGEWKLDVGTTFEKALEKAMETFEELPEASSITESQGKFVDLAVLDIKVSPDSPIAGDKETEIEVRIKNAGTNSIKFDKEPLHYKYRINNKESTGTFVGMIDPEQIIRLSIQYDMYVFFTKDDKPGIKDIYFEIDPENKINDKDRSNNTLSQKIEFVAASDTKPKTGIDSKITHRKGVGKAILEVSKEHNFVIFGFTDEVPIDVGKIFSVFRENRKVGEIEVYKIKEKKYIFAWITDTDGGEEIKEGDIVHID